MTLSAEIAAMRATLPERPDGTLARVALGLSLYLDEPLTWARTAAPEALTRFLDVAPRASQKWLKTSRLSDWQRVNERELGTLPGALTLGWTETRVRHRFRMRLVDDPGAPAAAFSYQEVDDACDERTGVLQVVVPADVGPDALLRLATELGDRYPYRSGVGGYLATWNERERLPAFRQIFAWCRRCLGLDVQVPDEMALHAALALPGTNWLTLLGKPLAQQRDIDLGALGSRTWDGPITARPLGRGLLLQAGAAPTLGDVNELEYVAAYAEVAACLAPFLPAGPLLLWGPFSYEDLAVKWLRRFVEPDGWAA